MKRLKAGKSVILSNVGTYAGIINNQSDIGDYNVSYVIGSILNAATLYKIINTSETDVLLLGYYSDDHYNRFTNPYTINLGENFSVTLNTTDIPIYNSVEVDIPDKLYDMLVAFYDSSYNTVEIRTYTNTDGNSQDVLIFSVNYISIFGTHVSPSVSLKSSDDSFEFNHAGGLMSGRSYYYAANTPKTIESILTVEIFDKQYTINKTFKYAPPAYISVSEIAQSDGKYMRISNVVGLKNFHGNIYYNGGVEPEKTYVATNSTYALVKLEKTGAYTANIISEVHVPGGNTLYAYSILSKTLIVGITNTKISLTFDEYEGVLTAAADIGAVAKFNLYKFSNNKWNFIETNTTGIFSISTDGTYKVGGEANALFEIEDSDAITVGIVLESPNVYVDYNNPSQLGFDEVPNALEYDIYKLNEDGTSELYETVSSQQSNRLRSLSVNRKLKIFNVVTK